jgi:hypothetical protein
LNGLIVAMMSFTDIPFSTGRLSCIVQMQKPVNHRACEGLKGEIRVFSDGYCLKNVRKIKNA